jgi:hypothetical protein
MGSILSLYEDLRDPRVDIDAMRPEVVEFVVTVGANGDIVYDSGVVNLLNGYVFAISHVQGWAGDPDTAGLSPTLISFKIQELGRGQAVFMRALRLQGFIGPSGGCQSADFSQSFWYRCLPGTDLAAIWQVSPQWANLVGAQRTFGVRLLGAYYRCPPLQR